MPSISTPEAFLDRLLEVAEKGLAFKYETASRQLDRVVAQFQSEDLKRLERICAIGRMTIKQSYSGSQWYQTKADYIALFTRADHIINGPPARRR